MSDQHVKRAAEPMENKPADAPFVCPEGISQLGCWLEANRTPQRVRMWRMVMFVILGIMVVLNFIVPNHHPHFVVDKYPGFWPVFGLGVGVVMVFFVKRIVQPVIKRPEDYYGDL